MFLLGMGISTTIKAGSIYVGYGQSEQNSIVGERTISFSPSGASVLLSFDLNENLSLSFDYAHLSDEQAISNGVNGDLDLDSWGTGLVYYFGNWALSASYSDWQDELHIAPMENSIVRLEQETSSPSSSLSFAYSWDGTDWQIGLAMGIHYSNWSQSRLSQTRPNEPLQSAYDEGDSTFVSPSISAAKVVPISSKSDFIVGGSISWNHLTNSESLAISRNGRNISQISRRSNTSSVGGTESYGQLNIYVSYDISASWLVDVDSTFDIGSEENTQAWSINIGYLF